MALTYIRKRKTLLLPSVYAVNPSNTTESHTWSANIISLREIISSHRLVGAEPPSHSPGAMEKKSEMLNGNFRRR